MTALFVSAPRCPRCGRPQVRRSHRIGLIDHALSLAFIYPFRCRVCGRRFRRLHSGRHSTTTAGDRREFERVPVRVAATITRGGVRTQGTTADLSLEGCAIQVAGTFAPDDVVHVALVTADGGSSVAVTAIVRSATPEMIGVHFHAMSAQDRERLHRFLQHLLPAVDVEPGTWHTSPRLTALNFWITAMILLVAVLIVVAFMPLPSLCTWGINC